MSLSTAFLKIHHIKINSKLQTNLKDFNSLDLRTKELDKVLAISLKPYQCITSSSILACTMRNQMARF